ncbi:MAG: hypothetical protein FJ104_13520, partial [Deltaproteobacteria bacterium]|nr:hypothetical protein [Deltaproteobacteria bacterium]
ADGRRTPDGGAEDGERSSDPGDDGGCACRAASDRAQGQGTMGGLLITLAAIALGRRRQR